jgi:hypothetical protein
MSSSGMLRRVALVGTDFSEKLTAPMRKILPKHRLLQEPHGVTSRKTAFFKSKAIPVTGHGGP